MEKEKIEKVKSLIRTIPDFPTKGILFRDLTTAFKDAEGMAIIAQDIEEKYANLGVTKVVGIEARGFIGGAILARELGAGFVPLRKPGKLPADTVSKTYAKEYGTDTIEIHRDAITPDDVVVIHDDLLATGGTMLAAYELVKSMNPKKIYIDFIVELSALNGRSLFPEGVPVNSMIVY
ncbi:MAG: adenine phosphoribosyltransferase [Muribaculaceae bacterium]